MNFTKTPFVVIKYVSLAILMFINEHVFAVNPVNGFYAGAFLGASYSPNANFTVDNNPFSTSPMTGTVHYGILGDFGIQAGYRFNHFRVEGELFGNYNTYKTLNIGDITFNNPYPYYNNITMSGSTTTGAIMVNGFYDFYTLGNTQYWSPYIGAGVGYALINNTISFYNADTVIAGTNTTSSRSTPAGQFILGLGYFMDDYTTVGLDYRFFATQAVAPFTSETKLSSINIGIFGSFDRG